MQRQTRYICGIDEAGRGAVLGPLVIAGVLFEDSSQVFDVLAAHNVRDSKLLTVPRRQQLARLVRQLKHRFRTVKLTPAAIDERSINDLEIEHSAWLINELRPDEVHLDVPASGSGVERYIAAVCERCTSESVQVKGGNGMDDMNLAVAAASVIAKETREKAVRALHKVHGDFGSGYPHDPRTRAWLQKHNATGEAWPAMVRTKWSTVAQLS